MSRGVKQLLKKYNVYPSKRLGQNFLIDKRVTQKIIEAAELKPDDIVLEIGAGIGNLTRELAKKAKKVIAVEKDQKMCEILKETLKEFRNVEVIRGDVLKIQISNLKIQNYNSKFKIVANIPYYLTSPLIRKFLEMENQPILMVLMVQKEVAQRICPCPPKLKERRRGKTPNMNLLAVSVQFYAEPEIISFVSKNSFWPKPKVDSAVIKIVPRQFRVQVPRQFRERFFRIVRPGFSQPRKQLINNLSRGLKLDKEKVKNWLLKNNIQPSQRAETLTVEDWINLAKSFKIK